ncbi:hypothetical protein PSA01_02350 [Pseudonocardia saturnea]|uniref:Uncharacterized protein n=1 Tax=Pseudonocardia saturnea TaxID=33909 RepID=A0ABQ0RRC4_9PSEU|nr:hypothetical protein Pdca_32520 [Pseudonocardia autotrophica]GEC23206.1 hypothetical protein PSA01_02350 [Pseudonocardia saturnea]
MDRDPPEDRMFFRATRLSGARARGCRGSTCPPGRRGTASGATASQATACRAAASQAPAYRVAASQATASGAAASRVTAPGVAVCLAAACLAVASQAAENRLRLRWAYVAAGNDAAPSLRGAAVEARKSDGTGRAPLAPAHRDQRLNPVGSHDPAEC